MLWKILPSLFLILSCATVGPIGSHDPESLERIDFGEDMTIRFCIYKEDTLSPEIARRLVAAANKELKLFRLKIKISSIKNWTRPGFTAFALQDSMLRIPLQAPCDRMAILVDRTFGDLVWGAILPNVLGAVEQMTSTRGFMVAKTSSLGHYFMGGPEATFTHEVYHLLGCVHKLTLNNCYQRIQKLKKEASNSRELGLEFFPSLSVTETVFRNRNEVNEILKVALEKGLL